MLIYPTLPSLFHHFVLYFVEFKAYFQQNNCYSETFSYEKLLSNVWLDRRKRKVWVQSTASQHSNHIKAYFDIIIIENMSIETWELMAVRAMCSIAQLWAIWLCSYGLTLWVNNNHQNSIECIESITKNVWLALMWMRANWRTQRLRPLLQHKVWCFAVLVASPQSECH